MILNDGSHVTEESHPETQGLFKFTYGYMEIRKGRRELTISQNYEYPNQLAE
jgi:hypothetical protein